MRSTLALVVCGAPLASRAHELAMAAEAAGWKPIVTATPSAMAWLDVEAIQRTVGHPPSVDYRSPDQPKRGPLPTAVVLCPATFNSLNKLAAGIADNYAMGVLSEALGVGLPILAVPMINDRLWGHVALANSLVVLADAGVTFLDVSTGHAEPRPVRSGTGGEVVAGFDPRWITSWLARPAKVS